MRRSNIAVPLSLVFLLSACDNQAVTIEVVEKVNKLEDLRAENPLEVINQAPVAVPDSYTMNQADVLRFFPLVNDTDAENDALNLIFIQDIDNGSAIINGNSIIFKPDTSFYGIEEFEYFIDDAIGSIAASKITINVEDIGITTNFALQAINYSGTSDYSLNVFKENMVDGNVKLSWTDPMTDIWDKCLGEGEGVFAYVISYGLDANVYTDYLSFTKDDLSVNCAESADYNAICNAYETKCSRDMTLPDFTTFRMK